MVTDNRRQVKVDKQLDDVTVTNALLIRFSHLYQLEVERITASPIVLPGGHSFVCSYTLFFVTVTPRDASSRASPLRIPVLQPDARNPPRSK